MHKTLCVLTLLLITTLANAEFSSDYITQHPLKIASVNNIQIAYRQIGELSNPKILMIMGLGASIRVHGDNVVRGLEQAGYSVLIFDK